MRTSETRCYETQWAERDSNLSSISREKPGIPDVGGSKSGNIGANSEHPATPAAPTDPDLAAVVAVWADLPPAVRFGIVAMVKAASPAK